MTETPFRGPIHFDSATPSDAVHIADCSDMGVVYGGFYHNYHWYGQAIVKGTSSSVDGLYEIDMDTGGRTLIAKGGAKMIDLTYDYSSGKVFGIRSGNSWLAEFNPATGTSELIGRFTDSGTDIYMLAIAASLDGTLYGVSSSDNLYKINPESAALTLVGPLGADAAFDQTMAFDYSDGTLYWANNGDYILYTINTNTGQATAIAPIGKNKLSSMGSLFIPYINVPAGAPDRVTGVKGSAGFTSALISWVYPAITAQREQLKDLDGVIIRRDGEQIADIKASTELIGKEAAYVDENLAPDKEYSYEIIPYNNAGLGGCDSHRLTLRVGHDLPGVVENFQVNQGDGKALLSWHAPTTGATGGIFDPSGITEYEIKRNDQVIASVDATQISYEDAVPFGRYSYTVTAESNAGTGTPATRNDILVKPASWVIMNDGEAILEPGMEYKFYDEGGPDANYYNSHKYTLVVAPSVENAFVTVNFTKFNVETYGDYLSIYDGRGTEGRLIGKFAATSLPAGLSHIESSAGDGCLTFMFYSDLIESAPGWEADIKAIKRLENDLEVTSFDAPAVVVAGTPCHYEISVMNKGTRAAAGYSISLLDKGNKLASIEGTEISPSASASHIINYTPSANGNLELSAKIEYAADNDQANNTSQVLIQKVLPHGSKFIDLFAPEEQATDLYVLPASFFGFESISQIIIPSSEIESVNGMHLSAISFPLNQCTNSYMQVPFRVWVGETDQNDMTSGTIPASQLTEAFNGSCNIISGSRNLDFTFPTPYTYTGGNLVLMVHKQKSTTNNSGITFRGNYGYDNSHNDCSIFDSHSYDEDPAFDPDMPFGYSSQDMRPDMRLMFSSDKTDINAVITDGNDLVTVAGNLVSAIVPCRIYTPSGILVTSCASGERRTLSPGIYIVMSDAYSTKVAIR